MLDIEAELQIGTAMRPSVAQPVPVASLSAGKDRKEIWAKFRTNPGVVRLMRTGAHIGPIGSLRRETRGGCARC